MPVSVNVKTEEQDPASSVGLMSLEQIVDELGVTREEMAEFVDVRRERLGELEAALRASTDNLSPSQGSTIEGQDFVVEITKVPVVRKVVDMPGLMKVLGEEVFLQTCSFPVGKINDLLSARERKGLLEEKAGSRGLRIAKVA